MSKKEIKKILKQNGYKMIGSSWYRGDKAEQSALFIAYDKHGTCYHFFIDWSGTEYMHKPYAMRQMLSNLVIHELTDVSSMFFKGVA